MKWFFLFFFRGLSLGGPYDTEQDCVAALKAEIEGPKIDPGFDGAIAGGVCFQGAKPEIVK